jgi:ankyrin repeat protein
LFSALAAQSSDSTKIRRVRAAVAAGEDVNGEQDGRTVLLAAARENPVIVNDLLRAGADPNKAVGVLQETPLMQAVRRASIPNVMLLVAAGANVNARNPIGLTALDLLEGTNPINRLMQKLLKSYGAKHGTLDGKSIDAMLAGGDYRELSFDEPEDFKARQAVQWVSATTPGREFKGDRPYWLYEGQLETIQGVVASCDDVSCQIKVTKGAGAFRAGSVHRILRIDLQPADSE